VKSAYNDFLQQGVDGGMVGLLLYVAMIGTVLYRNRSGLLFSGHPAGPFVYAGLLGIVAMSLVNFGISSSPVNCIFLVYASVLVRYDKSNLLAFAYAGGGRRTAGFYLPFALFMAVSVALLYYDSRKAGYHGRLEEANELLMRRNAPAALHILQGVGSEARDGDYFILLGKAHLLRGSYKEAIRCFTDALTCSASPELYRYTAICYGKLGEPRKALPYYRQAVWLEPARLQPRYELMRTSVKVGDRQTAVMLARNIIASQPKIMSDKARFYQSSARRLLNYLYRTMPLSSGGDHRFIKKLTN
jgi:tetratricopeptide (TPR) repeat protein